MEISKNTFKKIVYIITLPDLGGAQSHVYEVISNIGKYGYEPILITGKEGWLTEQAEAKGIVCHMVPDLVRPIAPLHDFKAVRTIQRILHQEKPVLVHCHSSKAGIVGRIAAYSCNIPAIFTAHGWAFTDGVKSIKRRIYAFIENLVGYCTNKIICVSEYDRKLGERYLSAHKEKMVTIHNCIPDMPEYVRDWDNHPVGDVVNIIVVARFSPQKRNIQILHCLRQMLDIGIKITITFVGDGPLLEKAKSEARWLHLEKEAIFLGARTDVPNLLTKYDLFLLLSNWEGFPISIMEAMRAGLPIIASNVGGVRESVCNKVNGWLVGRDDTELISVMEEVFCKTDKLVTAGMRSREIYLSRFTVDRMMRKTIEVYKKL